MRADVDHRLHQQVFSTDRAQGTEGREVNPGHRQTGPLHRVDRGQHRTSGSCDQQAGQHAGGRVGGADRREVQNHFVQRQRDDLPGLKGQGLGALSGGQVRNLQRAHHHLRIGHPEDHPSTVETVYLPKLLERTGDLRLLVRRAVDNGTGRQRHRPGALQSDRQAPALGVHRQHRSPDGGRAQVQSDGMTVTVDRLAPPRRARSLSLPQPHVDSVTFPAHPHALGAWPRTVNRSVIRQRASLK